MTDTPPPPTKRELLRHIENLVQENGELAVENIRYLNELTTLRQRVAAAEAERDRLRARFERLVVVAQHEQSSVLMAHLGFDMTDTRWRFGWDGWERQGEHPQAGCFPATDWIDELLAGLDTQSNGVAAALAPQEE